MPESEEQVRAFLPALQKRLRAAMKNTPLPLIKAVATIVYGANYAGVWKALIAETMAKELLGLTPERFRPHPPIESEVLKVEQALMPQPHAWQPEDSYLRCSRCRDIKGVETPEPKAMCMVPVPFTLLRP